MELMIAKGASLRQAEQLYLEAFPAAERKPFEMLVELQKNGRGMIFAAADEERFLGLAVVLLWEDIALLDYLAVAPEGRGQGTGSEVLRLLAARFPDKRILIEIELPEENAPDNAQRARRKRFYLRAGFVPMEVRISLGGVPMELLSLGGNVSWEEYRRLQAGLIGEERVQKLLHLHRLEV